jgi:hypothetical protein
MSDSANDTPKGLRAGAKDSRRRSKVLTAKTYELVKSRPDLKMWTVRAAVYGVGIGALGVVPGSILAAVGAGDPTDPANAEAAATSIADSGNTPLFVAGVVLIVLGVIAGWTAANIQIAALVAASDDLLHDRPSDPAACRATARSHMGTLLGWSVISALVGLLVSFLRGDGDGNIVSSILRSLLAGVVAVVWSVITMLVMPVIVLENLGVIAAIKRSSSIIKNSWGTALLGGVRIGIRFGLIYTLPGLLAIAAGIGLGIWIGGPTGIAVAVVLVVVGLVLMLIGGVLAVTCRNVFGVALFRWSTNGEVIGPFTEDDLAGAVRTRS